jgi:Cu/Ag efflux protein CusF
MKRLLWLFLAVALPALAQLPPGKGEGIVEHVDAKAQEITIRHGYLPEIDMDPMTMVFRAADPAMLSRVRKGDRVRLKAGLVNGRFAVIELNPVQPKRKEKP